ncbi:putative Protein phosphatase 2A catalytic subunit B [Paratrimastix pyriformis]|uniref:Serine/threonine-protein phosphatase n=1 Tax=Paratrimastix pyriformis TaxID=342808 RepID=A0ABQ8UG76_9EUKA|nr:putative Protein phosphatase 2A catalytic subunit B [Paratrimastix pyriformis]
MSVDAQIEKALRGEVLDEEEIKDLCEKVISLLILESNVKAVRAPVTIVGDIHGQFYDLKEMFRVAGSAPDTNFLFLGDYVDRGYFSLETITLLCLLKLRYPDRITLLRGNHETKSITQTYGFYTECFRRYGNANAWQYFTDMFNYLTVSALIDGRFFCVHGGLSPNISSLDQIRVLDRFQEVPHEGAYADLVWSDPDDSKEGYANSQRGAGYTFGRDVVRKFLHENRIDHIMRAHQLCNDGFQCLFGNTLSTIWSAPNYCYRCNNIASVLEVDQFLNKFFNTYAAAPTNERVIPPDLRQIPDYFS